MVRHVILRLLNWKHAVKCKRLDGLTLEGLEARAPVCTSPPPLRRGPLHDANWHCRIVRQDRTLRMCKLSNSEQMLPETIACLAVLPLLPQRQSQIPRV